MHDRDLRLFWNEYARCYQVINMSPVYKTLVENTLNCAAVRRGDQCFDLGCGPGYIASKLYDGGAVVWAVDYSDEMLRAAQNHLIRKYGGFIPDAVHLVQRDANEFLLEAIEQNRKADVVVASLFISYVPDWEHTLSLIYRVLENDGRLVMSNPVPNANFWRVFFRSGWNAIRLFGSAMRILAYARKIKKMEQEDQFKFFSNEQTRNMLEKVGFPRKDIHIAAAFADTVFLSRAVKIEED